MSRSVLCVLATLFVIVGCKSPTSLSEDIPAVLTETNGASGEALQAVLFEIFKRRVLVAPDALTRSSLLVIEQRPHGSLRDLPSQGRIMVAPIQLRLVTNGKQCILIDQRSHEHYVLANTKCVKE